MNTNTQTTQGAHHIGLTVPNIHAARDFFVDALGFSEVGAVPDYPAVFVSDQRIMITLWQAEDPHTATPFDRRKNLGLHHLALGVTDLDALAEQLAERSDVTIEFEPQDLGQSGLRHLMCRIPGNLRLELVQS
ncbi:MAG: VOC family protein [Pseudomonadales bacterium]